MVDVVTPTKRSEMMAGIKGKNTKPEILVRKTLHALGFRFRLHRAGLAGKPDIVLAKYKTLVFVQGCFWHGHENCPIFRLPKSRTEFWQEKIVGNRLRDQKVEASLLADDWRIIYVWECALKGRSRLPEPQFVELIEKAVKIDQQKIVNIRGATEPVIDK